MTPPALPGSSSSCCRRTRGRSVDADRWKRTRKDSRGLLGPSEDDGFGFVFKILTLLLLLGLIPLLLKTLSRTLGSVILSLRLLCCLLFCLLCGSEEEGARLEEEED